MVLALAGCAANQEESDARLRAYETEIKRLELQREEEALAHREELGRAQDDVEEARRAYFRAEKELAASRASREAQQTSLDAALALLRKREEELKRAAATKAPTTVEAATQLLQQQGKQIQTLRDELARLKAGEADLPNPELEGIVSASHLDLEVPVARIDGQPIARRDFLEYLYRDLSAPSLLELFINRHLLLREARRKSYSVTDVDREYWVSRKILLQEKSAGGRAQLDKKLAQSGLTRKSWEAMLRYQAEAVIVLGRLVEENRRTPGGKAAWEARVVAAYAERFSDRIAARHIFVALEGDAGSALQQAALRKIKAAKLELERGVEFSDVARRLSEDPRSRLLGGSLGTFDRQRFASLPAFNRAVFTQELGKLSEPVRSKLGWHVVLVDDRKPPERKLDARMRAELSKKLEKEDASEGEINALITRLRAKTRIETNIVFDEEKK